MRFFKTGIKIVLLVAAILALRHLAMHSYLSDGMLPHVLNSLGIWAVVAFIGLFTLGMLASVPVTIFISLGAVIFGKITGALYASISFMSGACLAFCLGRYVLNEVPRRMHASRLQILNEWVTREGFPVVLGLRLALFGNSMLNYTLGMTQVQLKHYLLATLCGGIPKVFLISYICEMLIQAHSFRDLPLSYIIMTVLFRVSGLVLLLLLGVQYRMLFRAGTKPA